MGGITARRLNCAELCTFLDLRGLPKRSYHGNLNVCFHTDMGSIDIQEMVS